MAWTDLSAVASGTPPSARNGHGITSAGGKLYVHGGRGGSSSGGGACLGGGALPGGTVACRPVSRQGRVGILHLGQVCIGSAQNDRRFPNSLDACCWFVWGPNVLRLGGPLDHPATQGVNHAYATESASKCRTSFKSKRAVNGSGLLDAVDVVS